jgi:Tol biopolymer transport system component/tRNA A-37 threonylcarbamoyl transferase component Bud32
VSDATGRLSAALVDRYRIERELGQGGMATVYLAHDLKHDRDVAIKVLHSDLGAVLGAERFLAEIRTTARLHHPHILPLLDSGDAGGLLYYVMPFVTGETLRARLERERQLPVTDALRIAREVADALAAAHEKGIIHRDVKPENVLLQGGHALVADFGIALAVQHAAGQRMTQTGLSLGTPQYMSPEQAMGEKAIDARSDIYALGAITYEMLTGEPPFTGATVQAIVAKVLTEKPTTIRTVRDTVPPHVDAAVLTALSKLPADRFATATEFATALSTPIVTEAPTTVGRVAPTAARRRHLLLFAAAGLAAVAIAFVAGRASRGTNDAPFARLGLSTQVTWEPGLEITPAISPDGKLVAYSVGNGTASKIFVRPVVGGRVAPLTDDTIAVETFPEWSHDGSRILYIKDGQVFSAPAGGGPPRQEVPRPGAGIASATWSPDGKRIAYALGDSLFVQETGGTTRRLATFFQPSMCTWGPTDLIACAAGNVYYLAPGFIFGNILPNWLVVVNASSGVARAVTDSLASHQSPRWSRDGRSLLYASNRLGPPDLFMVMLGSDGSASSQPRRLTTGLNVSSFSLSGDDSRIGYAVMTSTTNLWSQPWSDPPSPTEARPTQVTFGEQTIEDFSISRDGKWVYYDSDLAGNADLYRMPLPSGVPERLTSTPTAEFSPDVSPDGREILFHSMRGGSRDVLLLRLDGSPVSAVAQTPGQELVARWSPDGRSVVYAELGEQSRIWLTRRGEDGTWLPRRRLVDGFFSQWSRDGRYVSYSANLYAGALGVIAVDSGAPRLLYDVTRPGAPVAETSAWSDDGRTLYFKSHSATGAAAIWSVPFAGGAPHKVIDLGDERTRSARFPFRIAGGRIYYPLTDRQANVWVIEVDK